MNPIQANAIRVLRTMVESGQDQFENTWLQEQTGLSPRDINDAIDYLSDLGAVKPLRTLGTAPFDFAAVFLQSRGRFLYHETQNAAPTEEPPASLPRRPLNPIGSPYGFTEYDFATVAGQKEDRTTLYVVVGLQFVSECYDTEQLVDNLKSIFRHEVDRYNLVCPTQKIGLNFKQLSAGLGEHLFNQIARDIIGADIAIFETSDRNPNVMIELGVALTWGVAVLPIRKVGCAPTPSDISGQTWIEYENSVASLNTENFQRSVFNMIKRIIGSKGGSR